MPEPIPAMLLARLAVDSTWHGRGLGSNMLADAVSCTLQAAEIAGIRAMVIDAIIDPAARFYEQRGFTRSAIQPLRLMAPLSDLARAFAAGPP